MILSYEQVEIYSPLRRIYFSCNKCSKVCLRIMHTDLKEMSLNSPETTKCCNCREATSPCEHCKVR